MSEAQLSDAAQLSGQQSSPAPGESSAAAAATADIEALVPAWMTLPDVAEQLSLDVSRVRQLVADLQLLAVRRDGVLRVPAGFIQDGRIVKGLPGTLSVLADSGFSREESLRWLFTPDDSLPGTPLQALAENRGTEVKRRAQASAF